MNKPKTGGFLLLVGTVWVLAIFIFAGNNYASDGSDRPGGLIARIIEMGMASQALLALVLLAAGLLLVGAEFFKKDK